MARLLFRPKPLQEFLHRYEDTRRRVDAVAIAMERQKTQLLTNIVSLDRLYADQTEQLQELELYIAAGDERLRRLDGEQLPALEREAAESGQPPGLRQLEDLRNARDDLQRRLATLLERVVAGSVPEKPGELLYRFLAVSLAQHAAEETWQPPAFLGLALFLLGQVVEARHAKAQNGDRPRPGDHDLVQSELSVHDR